MPRTWLITGSSRGLGLALAREVLEAGHSLVATARRPEQLSELVAEHGDRVRAVALDVADEVAAQRAVLTAVASFLAPGCRSQQRRLCQQRTGRGDLDAGVPRRLIGLLRVIVAPSLGSIDSRSDERLSNHAMRSPQRMTA